MAQSVSHPTLGLGSGHDLMAREIKPCVRLYTDRTEPAWDFLSPFLSAPSPLVCFLSLKINK